MPLEVFQDSNHGAHLGYRYGTFLNNTQLCKQQSYSLIGRMFRGDISFEEFQDGCHDEHLGYRNRTIFNNSDLYVLMPIPNFGSIGNMVREEMSFEVFQNGHKAAILHIGANKGILNPHFTLYYLTILSRHVALISPIKFRFNMTYDAGDVV